MTREESKQLLPIIQAFAEGKTIEYREYDGEWKVAHTPTWSSRLIYRIKPDKEYRPFKTRDECWMEMKKHEPFAWILNKKTGSYVTISYLSNDGIQINGFNDWYFEGLMKNYTFADGKPFGIKDE